MHSTSGELLGNSTLQWLNVSNSSIGGLTLGRQSMSIGVPASGGYTQLDIELLHGHNAVWSTQGGAPMKLWAIPPWLSVLPALATVVLALVLQQVVVALSVGVFLGATFAYGLNPLTGALRLVDSYLPDAVGAGSHPLVIVFTLLLGGTIGVVRASGGAAGLARLATRLTTKPSHVLLATAGLGAAVGIDDYASVLITGSAMQPIAAAMGVHPLRLAWVVHGIGVCVPSIHPLSSWFGVQLALVSDQMRLEGLEQAASSPLLLLLATTPYRLYPLLHMAHILLCLVLPWSRDWGSMAWHTAGEAPKPAVMVTDAAGGATSEMCRMTAGNCASTSTSELPSSAESVPPLLAPSAAASCEPLLVNAAPAAPPAGREAANPDDSDLPGGAAAAPPTPGPPPNAIYATVPLGSMLLATLVGMYLDGKSKLGSVASASILDTLAAANSTAALTWATMLGNLLAVLLPLVGAKLCARGGSTQGGGGVTLTSLMGHWVEGVQECVEALVILLLAWSLGAVVNDLHTATFLSGAMGAWLPPSLLPMASMLLAMATSFGIGSAWGTLGVLVPLVAPLAWELSGHDLEILTASLGAVMGGSVFGNVSSPLADTSVLTAMVCRCEMLPHVSSQASYTALTAALSLLVGALPVGLGLYPIGAALAVAVAALALAPLALHAAKRSWKGRRLPRW